LVSTAVKPIHSLARGLQVLQMLQASRGMTLHDLFQLTAIPKASLLRILKTLMAEGLVWQRMADAAYVPSFSMAELARRIDGEIQLVEIASPILAALSEQIEWPSVLAVPRLTHMEVIETNAAHTYFDRIALGPIGFRVNMLRSASGRAYLAHCEAPIREAILDALRRSDRKGDLPARSADYVARALQDTRDQGYGLRDPDFGGHYDAPRSEVDDGRESIGVAIRIGAHVPGAINITWTRKVHRRDKAVALFLPLARRAAADIATRLAQSQPISPGEMSQIKD
jgi:IclR family transcriptional regulator, mhp operon transcriptional activator